MILLDASLLVYAHVRSFAEHDAARSWLDGQLNGSSAVGLPWHSLLAFLRIVTNPECFNDQNRWRVRRAKSKIGLAAKLRVPEPTERHREVLRLLLTGGGIQANLVPDAHLAALALEHGLMLCSTDGDFGRFSNLRWQNPLVD